MTVRWVRAGFGGVKVGRCSRFVVAKSRLDGCLGRRRGLVRCDLVTEVRSGSMARRPATKAERIGRERIKARHDLEVTAVGDLFGRERRTEQLRAEIAALTVEQGAAAATLADTSGVASWPCTRLVTQPGARNTRHARCPGRSASTEPHRRNRLRAPTSLPTALPRPQLR